jgi:hypothetical protein
MSNTLACWIEENIENFCSGLLLVLHQYNDTKLWGVFKKYVTKFKNSKKIKIKLKKTKTVKNIDPIHSDAIHEHTLFHSLGKK